MPGGRNQTFRSGTFGSPSPSTFRSAVFSGAALAPGTTGGGYWDLHIYVMGGSLVPYPIIKPPGAGNVGHAFWPTESLTAEQRMVLANLEVRRVSMLNIERRYATAEGQWESRREPPPPPSAEEYRAGEMEPVVVGEWQRIETEPVEPEGADGWGEIDTVTVEVG
jgi:hypothetical protein